jgi:hypothetical protein
MSSASIRREAVAEAGGRLAADVGLIAVDLHALHPRSVALRHWVERPDADPAKDGTAGRGVGIIVGHPDDPEVATGPHLSTTTSTPRRRVA